MAWEFLLPNIEPLGCPSITKLTTVCHPIVFLSLEAVGREYHWFSGFLRAGVSGPPTLAK
jgi:hypothetical protein